ncbi:MAG: tetratricopeptide repeat protein, partial [Bdellovibrionales bacterium]|nr:tetratricopeptide repeat protein [Bdellovibrionales bacterium]
MDQDQLHSKIYIIKSAQQILGPFTIKEIIDQIWEKKIHAFDEVKTPFTRWSFLRDDAALGKVFKDIIESRVNSEETEDLTTTLEKTAFTVSQKLLQIKELSHHTASVVDYHSNSFDDYKDDAEDIMQKNSSISVISVKPGYKKSKSKAHRYIYMLILLVSIVLFGSLLLEESMQVKSLSVNSTLWDRSNYLGDTKTVLSIYDSKAKYNAEVNYKFIEANISENKYLEAERIIKTMSSENLPSKDRAKLLNYSGVIELERQNFDAAIAAFKNALELDPGFEEAQINLVDGYLLIDDVVQAKAFLPDEVKLENAQSTSVYLHYETLFFDENFTPEDDLWLNEVFSSAMQPYDQRQEIMILLGLLLLEKKFENESLQIFQRALDVDPNFLHKNVQSQALYHPKVVVQKTLVFLKRFEYKYQSNPYYLASMAMLYHKTKADILARKYLEQALRIDSSDAFLQ